MTLIGIGLVVFMVCLILADQGSPTARKALGRE